jgi:hypothetical protein
MSSLNYGIAAEPSCFFIGFEATRGSGYGELARILTISNRGIILHIYAIFLNVHQGPLISSLSWLKYLQIVINSTMY